MAKDPAFLFYPSDWDGGTKLFTRHEKGAYMDLLMCQFHNGHMTKENLVFILGKEDYDLYWEAKIKSKFLQDGEGKFYNEKLENEQIKRRNWCYSRANNKEGINQYSGHMTKHMKGHMENENEDVNKDKKEYTDDFEKFWKEYPNKKEKTHAFKCWQKLKDKPEVSIIINAIKKQIEWRKNSNGEFRPEWKNPATWLNKGCWDDELKSGGNYGNTAGSKKYLTERDKINATAGEEVDRIIAELESKQAAAGNAK